MPPRTRSFRVVIDRRPKQYDHRTRANPRAPAPPKVKKDQPPPKDARDDQGGFGWEIVHEVTTCPTCAAARGIEVPASELARAPADTLDDAAG